MRVLISVVLACMVLQFSATAPPVRAAEEAPARMDEVVVTATRESEEIRKIPANVSVITESQLAESGATTVVEALEKLESIHIRSYSGNPSQAVVDLRGFGGDNPYGKTLILLDGRRLNRPDMASINWLQIPLSNVERIEVVRGGSSALYGDNAVGGVINIITKKGAGKPTGQASVILGSYGLHDERAGVSGSLDKFSYAVNGENQRTFGYRERSKFTAKSAGLDLGYDFSEYLGASLSLSANRTSFALPGTLTKSQMEQDRRQYQPGGPWTPAHSDDEMTEDYQNGSFRIESFLGDYGALYADFLFGSKDIEANMPSQFSNQYNDYDIQTWGFTPKYVLEKALFGHRNKFLLGLDLYRETMDVDKFGNLERTLKTHEADFTRTSLGVYAREEFSLLDDLILAAGYRTERTKLEGTYTNLSDPSEGFKNAEKVHHADAWELGLTYLLGERSNVFARFATVYRYPFLDEQASYLGTPIQFLTDLDKEKGKSYDIGTRFFPLENLMLGITLYRIDMEDEIKYVGIWPTGKNVNLDETRHEGVELKARYTLPGWFDVTGNATYEEAFFTEGAYRDKEIPLVPQWMANGELEIFLPFDFVLRPEVHYRSNAWLGDDLDNSAEKLEGYTTYNLFLFYRPRIDGIRLSAFFGVENLTDVEYATYGYDMAQWGMENTYYPAPGITVKGGLTIEF